MGEWRRCENCRYVRHANDDGRNRPDTCPRCGAVYEKAAIRVVRENRRRSFRAHANLAATICRNCREPVSVFSRTCPLCEEPLKTPFGLLATTVCCGFAIIVAVAWIRHDGGVASPYPGVSDTHFQSCVGLSVDWVTAREREGVAAPATIRAQNAWHARCSRKALRDIATDSASSLPATPQGWLNAASS